MTTHLADVAAERRLEWLLDEVLGGVAPSGARPRRALPRAGGGARWLAAAAALLATGLIVGTAMLRRDPAGAAATTPLPEDPPWREAFGEADLAALPAGTTSLRCYAFDDALAAKLVTFRDLERLDLGGLAPDARGITYPPKVTDAVFAVLATLPKLRWLSLAHCEQVRGEGIAALAGLPMLEHLDLTYTQVASAALAELPRLPSLRELSLASCLSFHGRSLVDVAKLPGLRWLSLRGCATVAAADVLHLAKLRELRWLDLQDCCGRYRGQTMDLGGPAPVDEPTQDGIGVTDAAVAALTGLPLQHLDLAGCVALTDAVGTSLAKFPGLEGLALGELPRLTGAVLPRLPAGLVRLSLRESQGFTGPELAKLPKLPALRELDLSGLPLGSDQLVAVLANRDLQVLRLGGEAPRLGRDGPVRQPELSARSAVVLAGLPRLVELDLAGAPVVDVDFVTAVAGLPALRTLAAMPAAPSRAWCQALARSRSLAVLRLRFAGPFEPEVLRELAPLRLQAIDLYGTKLAAEVVRTAAAAWPGCRVTLADGQVHVVPAK